MAAARDVADACDVTVDRVACRAGCRKVVERDFKTMAEQLDEADAAEGWGSRRVDSRGDLSLMAQDKFAGSGGRFGHDVDPVGAGAKLNAADSIVTFGDGFPAGGKLDGETAGGVTIQVGKVSVRSGVFFTDQHALAAGAVLLREGADKAGLFEVNAGLGFDGLRRSWCGMADEAQA